MEQVKNPCAINRPNKNITSLDKAKKLVLRKGCVKYFCHFYQL